MQRFLQTWLFIKPKFWHLFFKILFCLNLEFYFHKIKAADIPFLEPIHHRPWLWNVTAKIKQRKMRGKNPNKYSYIIIFQYSRISLYIWKNPNKYNLNMRIVSLLHGMLLQIRQRKWLLCNSATYAFSAFHKKKKSSTKKNIKKIPQYQISRSKINNSSFQESRIYLRIPKLKNKIQ